MISGSVGFSAGFIPDAGIPKMMHARSQWLCDKNCVDFYDISFQTISLSDNFLWVMLLLLGICCVCLSMPCMYFKL